MAALIVGFEVDFALLLPAVMHERAFKVRTTYSYTCMIFSLCRSAHVPIWHIDQLKTLLGTVYIGLIRDKANDLAPRRGPHQYLSLFGENLADKVEHAQTATPAASESTDTTPVESIPSSSTAPRSSRSSPFLAFVLLARVQKLHAQMATLMHHI